jgi:hypothetical protein
MRKLGSELCENSEHIYAFGVIGSEFLLSHDSTPQFINRRCRNSISLDDENM